MKVCKKFGYNVSFRNVAVSCNKVSSNLNNASKKIADPYIFLTSYEGIMNTYDAASGKKIMGFKGANMSC